MLHTVKSALTIALERFIQRRRNRRLLAKINAAYAGEPTEEETTLLERMRHQQRRALLLEPRDIDS